MAFRVQQKKYLAGARIDGVAALFLVQGSATPFVDMDDVSSTGPVCTTELKQAPFQGTCWIRTCDPGRNTPISAGVVSFTGPGLTIALSPNPDGSYDPGPVTAAPWSGGEPVTIQAQGAQGGVAPFSHTHRVPVLAIVTSPQPPQTGLTVSISQPLDFSWTVPAGADQDASKFTVGFGDVFGTSILQCDYPLRTFSRGRVPAALLSRVAPPNTVGFLGFDVRQERAELRNNRTDLIFTLTARLAERPGGTLASWFVDVVP